MTTNSKIQNTDPAKALKRRAASTAPQQVLSGDRLRQLFERELQPGDPAPSLQACEKLAHDIQIIVNRAQNAELEREAQHRGCQVDELLLKYVSQSEGIDKRVGKYRALAKQMLAAGSDLEEFCGSSYQWTDGTMLADVQQILGGIALAPEGCGHMPEPPRSPTRGHPRESWHAPARDIGHLIARSLREIGHKNRLSITDAGSITAIIAAAVMLWIFEIKISPEGYASAMRGRNRGKKTAMSFEERYPHATRIKILK